jgi:hypothetical protein
VTPDIVGVSDNLFSLQGAPVDDILSELSLRDIKGNDLKVLLAFYGLETEAGVQRGKRFSATLERIRVATNLSFPTIVSARGNLEKQGVIMCAGSGTYTLCLKKVARPYPLEEGEVSSVRERVILKERKKKSFKGGRACNKVATGMTHTERRLVVKKALDTLRVADTGKYAQLCMAKLTLLLADGVTVDQALTVARWSREKFDGGDKFFSLLNLLYLWSRSRFPALLAAATTAPFHGKKFSVISDPSAERAWADDYQRRVRERGLVPGTPEFDALHPSTKEDK